MNELIYFRIDTRFISFLFIIGVNWAGTDSVAGVVGIHISWFSSLTLNKPNSLLELALVYLLSSYCEDCVS